MKGVHCHTSAMMIETIGNWLVQSTGEMPTVPISQLTRPYVGSNIEIDQSIAPATGMMRNGVMSSVRMKPRPTNFRSSSRASPRPSSNETTTQPRVNRIEFSAALRNVESTKMSR